MTITISLLPLAIVAVVALAWVYRGQVSQLVYGVLAELARRRLERELGCRIVYVVGDVGYSTCYDLRADLLDVPPTKPIAVLIHTAGGDGASACIAAHILRHYDRVDAFVPARAWSAGTQIACAADTVHIARFANLGPCDPVVRKNSDWVYTGAVFAANTAGIEPEMQRLINIGAESIRCITASRLRRCGDPVAAAAFANKIAGGPLGDHERPLFLEDVRDLPLPAELLVDRRWRRLARLRLLSLPPELR